MTALLRLSDILAAPCRWVARLAGWMLLALVAVILYDVIGRRFFLTGSFKLQELQWHIHGAIAVLAFGHAYVHDAHVRIDVFAEHLAPRRRLWIELAGILLFLLPFMAVILWTGWDFAWRAFERGESSPGGVGLTNRWIIKSAVPLSALLAMAGGLSVACRGVAKLAGPEAPEPFREGE
jgi:TRAP-type mannitol/chloroaromatic compound transport system permease small subunit